MIPTESLPTSSDDWITQAEIARMFRTTPQTACKWAKEGRLRRYEHGIGAAGRRKYSRRLVQREYERCYQKAFDCQDELVEETEARKKKTR